MNDRQSLGWQRHGFGETTDNAIGFDMPQDFLQLLSNFETPETHTGGVPVQQATATIAASAFEETASGVEEQPLYQSGLSSAGRPQRTQTHTNQHSLPRRRSKYLLRRSANQKSPIIIPSRISAFDGIHAMPMQRWRNSPPEDEAASLPAIYGALKSARDVTPPNVDPSRRRRGPSSSTSLDSGASESSVQSNNSSRSATSTKSQFRVRARTRGRETNMNAVDRIFKCTFCCDTFKHKYDWTRHEKSLHLSLEEWECTPKGTVVADPRTETSQCAFCNAINPDSDHLESHNHLACLSGRNTQRNFRRKDHLVQHLRHTHKLVDMPPIDDWKIEITPVISRCGFCNMTMTSWEQRTDHLVVHFRNGKTMLDWQGDHGFDATVAARVSHSLPPYLIGSESLAPVPFSATNPASIDHFHQISSQIARFAPLEPMENQEHDIISNVQQPLMPSSNPQEVSTVAFADILSRHLSQFARHHLNQGVVPTDTMFQCEARRVLYDDEHDTWNTTIADNPDWLNTFRQQNGLIE